MTGGATVRTFTDNMAVTGFTGVPCPLHERAIFCCAAFGASVPNHAAIYCRGNGELLHHLPEQLVSGRYSEKWQRRTHSVWRHRHWRICLHGDLQRFGRRLEPVCEHGSGKPSELLSFYGCRAFIANPNERRLVREYGVLPVMTRHRRRCTPVFTGTTGGAGHPYCAATGRGRKGVDCRLCWGRAAIIECFFTAGASMALWGNF